MSTTTLVRPASPGRESMAVLALCALILVISATAVMLRTRGDDTRTIAAWQIDARTGLTPAEQGVLADLTIAAGEIDWLREGDALPLPSQLNDEGIPPFAPSASDHLRGNHTWVMIGAAGGVVDDTAPDASGAAYLGVPADGEAALAGSFLLIPGGTTGAAPAPAAAGHTHGVADPHDDDQSAAIWLLEGQAGPPADLSRDALSAAGWRQIISHYDPSVTRRDAPTEGPEQ